MSTTSPPAPLAGWPRRVIALVIDWFVALLSVSLVTRTPLLGETSNPWLPLVAFFVEVTVVTALLGYSIGQRLTGVRVVRMAGGAVDPLRVALRTFLICLIVPPVITDADQRGLHDIAAGSIAVRAPQP